MGKPLWTKWLKLLLLLIINGLLFGCAITEPVPTGDKITWVGEMTGMATGKLELIAWRAHGQGDVQSISSTFDLEFGSSAGAFGHGNFRGRLTGRIKDGVLEATISGHVESQDGADTARGKFVGTVSETQGFGTWEVLAAIEMMYFSGEWFIEKKENE